MFVGNFFVFWLILSSRGNQCVGQSSKPLNSSYQRLESECVRKTLKQTCIYNVVDFKYKYTYIITLVIPYIMRAEAR